MSANDEVTSKFHPLCHFMNTHSLDRDSLLWVYSLPPHWAKMHKQSLHWGWIQRGRLRFQPQMGRVLRASHTVAPQEPTSQQRAHTASPGGSVETCHSIPIQLIITAQRALESQNSKPPHEVQWVHQCVSSGSTLRGKCWWQQRGLLYVQTQSGQEKKTPKHEDKYHRNPSLWKPSTSVKVHSGEGIRTKDVKGRSLAYNTGMLLSS